MIHTEKSVKWSSSNPKGATVSKTGLVTAKKAGNVTITAKVGKKKLTCAITVITAQESYINNTIRIINKERRKYGFSSFDRNPLLMSAAQKRAKELSEKILRSIAELDKKHDFYYNVPIENGLAIEFDNNINSF